MACRLARLFLLILVIVPAGPILADDVLLSVSGAPPDGLVVAPVDLTGAVAWCKLPAVAPAGIRAVLDAGGKPVPFQFVPDADFDGTRHAAGTVIVRLPGAGDALVRLRFGQAAPEADKPFDGTVTTPFYAVTHDPKRQGGFPSPITFPGTGKVFGAVRWADRLHHRQLGSFNLAGDTKAEVRRVAAGPLATVVRVRGRYVQGDKWPESHPEAVYDWYYFPDRPLVYVTAAVRQAKPFTWHETHFLEITTPGKDFLHWAGGEPFKEGTFTGTGEGFHFPRWGALVEGRDAIGMFRCGQALFYDQIKSGGTYLQAHGDAAWRAWSDTQLTRSSWLWIGSGDEPARAVQAAAAAAVPTDAHVAVLVDSVRTALEAARKQAASLEGQARAKARLGLSAAEQLAAAGRFGDAVAAARGQLPASWTVLRAGGLELALERTGDGLRLVSLREVDSGRELAATKAVPLFRVTLRHAQTKEEVPLAANAGWGQVEVVGHVSNVPGTGSRKGVGSLFRVTALACGQSVGRKRLPTPSATEIRWQKPKDARLGGLRVVVRVTPDAQADAFRWTLAVENVKPPWGVWRVVFPQVAVADPGPGGEVFYPRGAGQVERDCWQRGVTLRGTYPSGWTSMPFMAAYGGNHKTGLYVAMHDPLGSTKDVVAQSRPSDRAVDFSFDHPAANMGVAGSGFKLEGEGVWRLLRGDWFDAAVIYRDWVRKHAKWYPKLGPDGREDTPLWMRELPAWAQTGGAPQACEKPVAEMARSLGVPIGFHWYRWHQIPFDNDYPHYFPTKPGFAESVARLQKAGVYVMPYINGRLWDTHDKGTEDFEFSKLARAAATKDEKGEPYIEMYGSKESNGERVRLAVMCPTTELWQKTVRQTVLRLFSECGVKGVYIDQVAAAGPRLCFDRSHGHPLGGGHWWTEGYWKLLGAIQMFGRAYRGGPTRNLALRMKAGQQLVFGEQLGWLGPGELKVKENLDFFRSAARLRWRLRRYFYAGEMARPPRLVGKVPKVTADWQWSGVWPVTTDAVMAGAWRLPREKKLVLLFANVGDQPVTARVDYDTGEYGLGGPAVKVTRVTADAAGEGFTSPPKIAREVTFPPRATWAWEVSVP